jgi:hypothetical protein
MRPLLLHGGFFGKHWQLARKGACPQQGAFSQRRDIMDGASMIVASMHDDAASIMVAKACAQKHASTHERKHPTIGFPSVATSKVT